MPGGQRFQSDGASSEEFASEVAILELRGAPDADSWTNRTMVPGRVSMSRIFVLAKSSTLTFRVK